MRLRGANVRRALLTTAGALAAVAVAFAIAAAGFLRGWNIHRLAPDELAAKLSPYEVVSRPSGPGPFPVVLLFHGCGGVRAFLHEWARFFVEQGAIAVVVDSLAPRGLAERWQPVCSGRALLGRERAGDALVAVAQARALPGADPARIFLAGWSHGAWTVMDLLALDPPAGLPTSLAAAPGDLQGVAGAILFYPYCGFAALAHDGWRPPVPAIALLAGEDTVVKTPECVAAFERARAHGNAVEVTVYPGVDHVFDAAPSPGHPGSSHYAPAAATDARAKVAAFLSAHASAAGARQALEHP